MKKVALMVAVVSLVGTGVAFAELGALKGLGKEMGKDAGKSVAASAPPASRLIGPGGVSCSPAQSGRS